MKHLGIKEIEEILPHRHPFLLIDYIEDYEPGEFAAGYKCVTFHEDFFRGHFPQEPVMPGVLIVEALAQTGAVAILSKEENKGKLFIVCFDEMNLARVEHYFSQFLSLLERPENQRELQLYDSQYAGQLYNSATYPSKIIIGDNIRFIGTVNIDESTYHFSDKVLDRANVIELDVLDYSKEWTKKQYASLITPTWSKDEYDALINKDVDIKADKVQELLWEIHQLLQSASAKYGVGPRIVKAIKMYINNLPKTEINGFNKGVALDYQIAQRILTKVRGPEIQIGRLLNGKSNTGFNQIFDKYSELSDFKKCRKVISEKQKELGAYGYCI